jgi:unsaturated rhamnogalacturonyl hydrolase
MYTEHAVSLANSFITRYPVMADMPYYQRRLWHYEIGCMLTALEKLWNKTGDERYEQYIESNMDVFVREDGTIWTYELNEYNVDQINQGKALFYLYGKTGYPKYKTAIDLLMTQLKGHPRTSEGGFWHKKIYPFQMWLDGVYMTAPFLAAYAQKFSEPHWYDEVANEILLMEKVSRDPATGLLYHGWDETKEEHWANKETGCSPHFWSRSVGWFAMAVVDVLDFLPLDHPKRGLIIGIFHRLAGAIQSVQDRETGLWHQVLNMGGREGNYLEASGSSMFVYSLAKGARLNYLDEQALECAAIGYRGLIKHCLVSDEDGTIHLDHTCGVAGLGNRPYRDGSYAYYVNEKTRRDDPKGVAPFIMAGVELEAALVLT